jgi:hypothetical protein
VVIQKHTNAMKTSKGKNISGFSILAGFILSVIIVIALVGFFNFDPNRANNRRTAQYIAAIYNEALEDGAVIPGVNLEEKVQTLMGGVTAQGGPWAGRVYKLERENMWSQPEKAYRYLTLKGGRLYVSK